MLVRIGCPDTWERQSNDFHLSTVGTTTVEYKDIQTRFDRTMPGFKIKKIERIQRFYLWHEYQLAKHRMAMKNEGEVNEMELFHGTNQTDPSQIYKSPVGFDIKYADSRGLWGTAIYFARKASYSHKYCYAKTNLATVYKCF